MNLDLLGMVSLGLMHYLLAVSAAPAQFPTSNRCCTSGARRFNFHFGVQFSISQAGIAARTLTLIVRF